MHPPFFKKSKMCISAIICQKLSSLPLLRKLWNVIVGYHDCNCSMCLPIFSSVDARSPKKQVIIVQKNNLDHRQHRSLKLIEKSQLSIFSHNFEHCVYSSPISKNKFLAPPTPLKKFLHMPLHNGTFYLHFSWLSAYFS